MSALADPPQHTHSQHRDSMSSEESLDLQSTTEHESLYQPIAPTTPYPSPYRASTAAAFMDINKALAVRSLQDSVRRSSTGNLPTRNTLAKGSCSRCPPPAPSARFATPAAEPQRTSPEPIAPPETKPALGLTRSRSMTAYWKPWSPLRSKRAHTHSAGDKERPVEVALNEEGPGSPSSGTRSSGDARAGEEGTPHPDVHPQNAKSPRKRRSTVHCIIM